MVAEPLTDPAGSSGPLLGAGLGDPLGLERGDIGHRIEARSLDLSGVDDVDDVADGDRRFADVRRQDDLAAAENRFVDERVQEVDVGVVVEDDVVGARFGGLGRADTF